MKKQLITAALTLLACASSMAQSDFSGRYTKTSQIQDGKAFCHDDILIEIDQKKNVSYYVGDFSYGPVVQAPMGGQRSYKSSHGEAMSTSHNTDSANMKGSELVLSTNSKIKVFGVWVGSEDDAVYISRLNSSEIKLVREMSEVGLTGSDASTAECTYRKVD